MQVYGRNICYIKLGSRVVSYLQPVIPNKSFSLFREGALAKVPARALGIGLRGHFSLRYFPQWT